MGNAKHARKTRIFVDGTDLTNYFNQADTDHTCPALDSTAFGDSDETFESGVPSGKGSLRGLFYAKAGEAQAINRDAVDDVLHPLIGDETVDHYLTICQEGADAQGLSATVCEAKFTKYSVAAPAKQLVSCMAEVSADGGMRYGALLAEQVARTVTGQGAAYDLGAASAKGFEAHLHAFAFGATTSVVVTVEDSADGTTGWATVGTFASVNSRSALRLSVTGAVRRYVRAKWTFTGTNGATFAVAFALKVF